MNYFYKISDKNGFVHSIDNVVFCYLLKNYNMEKVSEELIAIRDLHGSRGWSKMNCSASSKYSWSYGIITV